MYTTGTSSWDSSWAEPTVQTGKDGNKTAVGIRGHRCYNQPDFRRFAERIIKKMTERYGSHPSVTAWQIDNELESNFCFCDVCISQYRDWLRIKYGSLQELNQAYGNNVWSGEYSSWEQVKPPFGNYPQAWLNPAYMLDFYRYASDNVIKFITWQANLIRQTVPNIMHIYAALLYCL